MSGLLLLNHENHYLKSNFLDPKFQLKFLNDFSLIFLNVLCEA